MPSMSKRWWEQAAERIAAHKARVAVIGMGYVGTAAVRAISSCSFSVVGIETDPERLRELRSLRKRDLRATNSTGAITFADRYELLRECDVVLICVQTPLNRMRAPELSFVHDAARHVRDHLHRGQLVVLESTTYPGTTDEEVLPILQKGPLRCGRDFFLAYCPERVDPGNPVFNIQNIPRVVGGVDASSTELAALFYRQFVPSVSTVSDARTAEAVKLLENIYRCVNIALVNELKVLFDRMGIDVWEVVDAAATKPFGFQPFRPGPGMGGHCVPVDPFYLAWKARQYDLRTRFIELAGEVNTEMPAFVFDRVVSALNRCGKSLRGARVLVLGVAYKAAVADTRETPAGPLLARLHAEGARISYNDPYVPTFAVPDCAGLVLRSRALSPALLRRQDCVVIVTDHPDYDYEMVVRYAPLIVDTRNATRNVRRYRSRIVKA